MNTLCVWCFADPGAAEAALPRVRAAAVEIDDAALISWPDARRTPAMRELGGLDGPGRLWRGFWGMLLGLVFLTPRAGPAFGAAAGAVAGSLSDFGIADAFVQRVRAAATPGTSALFVLCDRAAAARVAAVLDAEPLRSELSLEQERHLRDTLADA
ncbi:MAG TPA: DUF1269 domain-containing protein [Solirubrobacter sp.]|nr:DUF1269 domain-containing protein [Solirubrobacter sp.]